MEQPNDLATLKALYLGISATAEVPGPRIGMVRSGRPAPVRLIKAADVFLVELVKMRDGLESVLGRPSLSGYNAG